MDPMRVSGSDKRTPITAILFAWTGGAVKRSS
jgi:hypothetical protein